MTFDNLAVAYASLSPWAILSFGIILMMLDMVILQSEFFWSTGIGFLILGIIHFFELNHNFEIWLIPIVLALTFLQSNRLSFTSKLNSYDYEEKKREIIGAVGTLKVVEEEVEDGSEFYSYKQKIGNEIAVAEKSVNKIYKFVSNDGAVLPAIIMEDLKNGVEVEVVAEINGVVQLKGAKK